MLGSTALEVALGMSLLYLSLSMVCSAINEYYSALLGRRSGHLKDAIFSLIDQDDPKGRRFLALFFAHPLIRSLAPPTKAGKASARGAAGAEVMRPGNWIATEVDTFLKGLRKTPLYIPDRTFADVVVDILGGWSAPHDETAAMTPAAAVEAFLNDTRDAIAKVPGDLVQKGLSGEVDKLAVTLRADVAAAANPKAGWDALAATVAAVRTLAGSIAAAKDRVGLIAVLDDWDSRLRAVTRDRAAAVSTLKAAAAAFTTIRGAVGAVPESLAKAQLRARIDEEEAKLRAPLLTAGSSQSALEAAHASLATLQGLAGMLSDDGGGRQGMIGLLTDQRDALTAARQGVVTIQKIRDAVKDLPDSGIKTSLRSLMDEEGEDLKNVKVNVQQWYNDSMDRVSGWYKRNTQLILFFIAMAVAFGMNADTLAIVDRLLQDPVLRTSASEAARGVYARDKPRPQAQPQAAAPAARPVTVLASSSAPAAPAIIAAPSEPTRLSELPESPFAELPAETKTAPPAETKAVPPALKSATKDKSPATSEFTPEQKADMDKALEQLQLPMYWDPPEFDKIAALVGQSKKATVRQGLGKVFGLLLTTLALSMGAPFWYDLLGKVVNVRSAGKKPEKSSP